MGHILESGGVLMIIRAMNYGPDWDWVCEYLKMALSENTKGVVCEHEGELLAAMVCEGWTDNSVQTHIIVADKRALRHKFHHECARYVFTVADREKMIGIVPSDNEKALKLDKHFGFVELCRIKDAFEKGVDAVVMELHRDNCPYWERPMNDEQEAA